MGGLEHFFFLRKITIAEFSVVSSESEVAHAMKMLLLYFICISPESCTPTVRQSLG